MNSFCVHGIKAQSTAVDFLQHEHMIIGKPRNLYSVCCETIEHKMPYIPHKSLQCPFKHKYEHWLSFFVQIARTVLSIRRQ